MSETFVALRALDQSIASPQINILTNGGFEQWQRGTSFSTPTTGNYVTDKWINTHTVSGGLAFTIAREATIIDNGYSLKFDVTNNGGAGNLGYIAQDVENWANYLGKTVSLSVRVKSNVATSIRLLIHDGSNNTLSSYHAGDNTWQTMTVTVAIPISATRLLIKIGAVNNGDLLVGTTYIDSAFLVVGNSPVNFIPMHPADDLARCLRYFENDDSGLQITWYSNPTETNRLIFHFSVQKSAIPSMTFVNGTLSQATASSTGSVSTKGFTLALNSDGTAGLVRRINGTLNDAGWSAAVT